MTRRVVPLALGRNTLRSLAVVAYLAAIPCFLCSQATNPPSYQPTYQPTPPVSQTNNTWNPQPSSPPNPGTNWQPQNAMSPVGWAINAPNPNVPPTTDQTRWYVNNHPDLKTLDSGMKEAIIYSGAGSGLLNGSYLPNGRPNPFTQPNWYLPTTWSSTGMNWQNVRPTGFNPTIVSNSYPGSFSNLYHSNSAFSPNYSPTNQSAYRPPVPVPSRPVNQPPQMRSQLPVQSLIQSSSNPNYAGTSRVSNIAKAVEDTERALSLHEAANDKVAQAIGHAELAALYVESNKLDQAFEHTATAERMATEINDPKLQADVMLRNAAVYVSSGEVDRAVLEYRQAIRTFRSANNDKGVADAYAGVGWAYESLGRLVDALRCYEAALFLFRKLNDKDGEVRILIGRGSIYQSMGEFGLAVQEYRTAMPTASKSQQARILASEGEISLSRGKPNVALEHYTAALQLVEPGSEPALEGTILAGLGQSYTMLEPVVHYSQALGFFEQAQARMKEAGNRQGQAGVVASIGELNYRSAITSSPRAFQSCDSHWVCSQSPKGNLSTALKKYNDALTLMHDVGDRAGEVGILTNIGLVFDEQGKYREALQNYRKALDLMDELQASARIEEFRIDIAGQAAGLYTRAILLEMFLGHPDQAFNLSERARARAFLDELGNPRLNRRLPEDFVEHEEAWRKANVSLERRIHQELSKPGPEVDQEKISALESQRTKIRERYLHLVTELKLNDPDSATLLSISPLTVREAQQQLDPDVTAVSYFTTPNGTLAFVLTRKSFHATVLPVVQGRLAWTIATLLDFPSDSGVPPSLKELHKDLIAPIKSQLKTTKLAVIPHGVLHRVPFAALTRDGTRFLSDDYAVFSLPSLSALPYIRARRKSSSNQALIFANDQEQGLSLLDKAYGEAREVATQFHTQPILGEAATVAEFQKMAGDYDIIHLIAHIDHDKNNPEISRILLGHGKENDGALETSQVAGLDLRKTGLVVLSGCQSQSGRLTRGDDMVGLTRAFIYAGSPSVIASLWSVDDEATRALMVSFYSHLRQGLPQADALRLAQIDVRRDYPHPYYWAGFVLTGDPGVTPIPKAVASTSH